MKDKNLHKYLFKSKGLLSATSESLCMSISTGRPLSQTCPGKQYNHVNRLSGHMTKAVDWDVKHQTNGSFTIKSPQV